MQCCTSSVCADNADRLAGRRQLLTRPSRQKPVQRPPSPRHWVPQVGAYAFTTLRPQLGVLRFPDGGALTMADVPGERAVQHRLRAARRRQKRPCRHFGCVARAVAAATRPSAPPLPPSSRPRSNPFTTTTGLVEGAHEGRGRGATFLGQIRKARALAVVVDLAGGAPGALVAPTPAAQLRVLRVRGGPGDAGAAACGGCNAGRRQAAGASLCARRSPRH